MIHRRAFTLVEILLTIMLFGLFGVLAMRLFRANMNVQRATFAANNNSARLDGAVAALRCDLAKSVSCEMPEPGLLRIYLPENKTVDWQTKTRGLSRKQDGDVNSWILGQNLNLKIDGAIVLLWSTDDPANQIAMEAGK